MRITLALAILCALLSGAAFAAPTAVAPPKIRITIDDTAVRQLIALTEAKDGSDAALDKWLSLPANQNLLRVGAQEDNLTRDQLKANALAVINGTATAETQPADGMGTVRMTPLADYKKLLADLQTTLPARLATITARDAQFSPAGTDISETVYLHLGGDWDAINKDGAIYINVRFWHDFYKPGWDGLNMIVAHETMHTVQNAAYGNPEAQETGERAWLTALSKIQREGIARYVEADTDQTPYAPGTYGAYYRNLDAARLKAFPSDVALLKPLYDACFPGYAPARFVQTFQTGIGDGGPYYDIGHGIAKAIDEKLGRPALVETMQRGPKDFFGKYIALCQKDKTLPALPPDVVTQIGQMAERL